MNKKILVLGLLVCVLMVLSVVNVYGQTCPDGECNIPTENVQTCPQDCRNLIGPTFIVDNSIIPGVEIFPRTQLRNNEILNADGSRRFLPTFDGPVPPRPKCGDGIVDLSDGEHCDPPGSSCVIGSLFSGTCEEDCSCKMTDLPPVAETSFPTSNLDTDKIDGAAELRPTPWGRDIVVWYPPSDNADSEGKIIGFCIYYENVVGDSLPANGIVKSCYWDPIDNSLTIEGVSTGDLSAADSSMTMWKGNQGGAEFSGDFLNLVEQTADYDKYKISSGFYDPIEYSVTRPAGIIGPTILAEFLIGTSLDKTVPVLLVSDQYSTTTYPIDAVMKVVLVKSDGTTTACGTDKTIPLLDTGNEEDWISYFFCNDISKGDIIRIQAEGTDAFTAEGNVELRVLNNGDDLDTTVLYAPGNQIQTIESGTTASWEAVAAQDLTGTSTSTFFFVSDQNCPGCSFTKNLYVNNVLQSTLIGPIYGTGDYKYPYLDEITINKGDIVRETMTISAAPGEWVKVQPYERLVTRWVKEVPISGASLQILPGTTTTFDDVLHNCPYGFRKMGEEGIFHIMSMQATCGGCGPSPGDDCQGTITVTAGDNSVNCDYFLMNGESTGTPGYLSCPVPAGNQFGSVEDNVGATLAQTMGSLCNMESLSTYLTCRQHTSRGLTADAGAELYFGIVGVELGGPSSDYVLDGSGSYDPSESITDYTWTCGSKVLASGASSVVSVPWSSWQDCCAVAPCEIGDFFDLTLTVTNAAGQTSQDTASVRVAEEVLGVAKSAQIDVASGSAYSGSASLNDGFLTTGESFVEDGSTENLILKPQIDNCQLDGAQVSVDASGSTVINGDSGSCEISDTDGIEAWVQAILMEYEEMQDISTDADDLGDADVDVTASPTVSDTLPVEKLTISCIPIPYSGVGKPRCNIQSFYFKGTKSGTALVSEPTAQVNFAWKNRDVYVNSGSFSNVVKTTSSEPGVTALTSADVAINSATAIGGPVVAYTGPVFVERDVPRAAPAVGCGSVINSPGTYTLTQDLTCTGDGIKINSQDVTLDCAGYTIFGPGYGSNTAIRAENSPYTTIKNCNLKDWGLGIAIKDSDYSLVSDIVANNMFMVVYVNPSIGVTVQNMVADSVQKVLTAVDSVVDLIHTKAKKTDKEVPPDAEEPEEIIEPEEEPGMVHYETSASSTPFERKGLVDETELEPLPGQECIGIIVEDGYTVDIKNSNVKKLTTGIEVQAGGTVNAGPNVAFCGNSLLDIDNAGTFNIIAPIYATNTVGVTGTLLCTYAPVTEEIGAEGGTVTTYDFGTTDGVKVDVPAGALDTEISLSALVQEISGTATVGGISGEQISGFILQPNGLNFALPATVTISYNDAGMDFIYEQDLAIGYNDPITGEWVVVDAFHDLAANTLSFQTTHFSEYGLFKLNYPNTIAVHADIHTVGTGSKPAASKSPAVGLVLNLYDRSSGSCAGDYSASWQNYPDIVDICTPIMTRVTNANGNANLGVLDFGDYVVIGANGEDKHLGTPVTIDSTYTQKYLQQIIKADGEKVPAKRKKYSGSEIDIIEPEYVTWDSTEELYPYLLESVDSWGVEVTLAPPEGYEAVEPALTETTPEYKAVQFTVVETGSIPDDTDVEMTLTDHKGKKQKHKSKTGIKLSKKLAKEKGVKVDKYGVLMAQKKTRGKAFGLTGAAIFGGEGTGKALVVMLLFGLIGLAIYVSTKKK